MKLQDLAALLIAVLVVPLGHADTILVGAPTATGGYYGMCCGSSGAAAQFTLLTSQFVTTIEVVLWGGGGTIFDFSLQNLLTSPTTIFASAVIPTSIGQNKGIVNVNTTLAAGTYYLVGKEDPSSPFEASGWYISDGILVTNAGSVINGIWSGGSTWGFDLYACGAACTAPTFTVNGPAAAPTIAANGVVNGASFQPGIVPNSWFTIQGTNLSSTTDTWDKSIVNGNLPSALDGVSVSVGGKPAYIYYVSPGQINAVAPDVGTGTVLVTVTNSNGTSGPMSVVSQTVGPGFFLWVGKYAVATRQDFSWAVKNGTFPGTTTSPSKPGDVIILWGTGFGPTSPAGPVGVQIPSERPYTTSNRVDVTVGGTPTQVYGAALAPGFAGLYQVAIQIPASVPDGDLLVGATVSGVQTSNSALITVQH